MYDAFAAGCLPIYLGAPNINEFIPTMDSVIDFQAYGSAELLAQELHRLSSNQTAYLEKFEWQKHPERWGKEFNQLQLHSKKESHTQCQLCQVKHVHSDYCVASKMNACICCLSFIDVSDRKVDRDKKLPFIIRQ